MNVPVIGIFGFSGSFPGSATEALSNEAIQNNEQK